MSGESQPLGRRERNKQAKLDRIVAAASELFAQRGVDEVTTQQVADAADIGTGTLFLYAKTKGELLLLVQNAHYAKALERGIADAAEEASALEAVLALLAPIVKCNRVQVENGRTYLREMIFGDPEEPRHAEALAIVGRTYTAVGGILADRGGVEEAEAATLAEVVSSIMFVTMTSSANVGATVPDLLVLIRTQIAAILPH